jgi:putative endonuclease
MYYLYILECRDGSYYTGITTDLKRRLKEHAEGTGARYTRARGAVRIVYSETFKNRSLSSKREAEIKSLTRAQKTQLIKTKSLNSPLKRNT